MLLNLLQCTGHPHTTENGPTQNFDSAEVEKSCERDWSPGEQVPQDRAAAQVKKQHLLLGARETSCLFVMQHNPAHFLTATNCSEQHDRIGNPPQSQQDEML